MRESSETGKYPSANIGSGHSRFVVSCVFQLKLPALEEVRLDLEKTEPMALSATAARAASGAFACHIAVPAEYRTVAAWFKRYSRGLAAAGANHRCAMGRSRTIPGASPTLFALLCLTARLAALGGRITALLKERLIRSGERKVLSTIAARELNIAGHGSPCGRLYLRVGKFYIRIFLYQRNLEF
jgi:hypothetical protein